MSLSIELQRLLPQALDVIRYLATREEGASVEEIMRGTGLGERICGKAIRRLVTRYYADMISPGVYRLSARGREAAQELHAYDGDTLRLDLDAPSATLPSTALPDLTPMTLADQREAFEPPPVHRRRVSVFVQKELVIRSTAILRAGFDSPHPDESALREPARAILRLSAPGCDIQPAERPVEIPMQGAAGPLQFRLTPRLEGTVRIRLEVFQLVTVGDLVPAGGMYFDLKVAEFPTPGSAEFQTLGVLVRLEPGYDA